MQYLTLDSEIRLIGKVRKKNFWKFFFGNFFYYWLKFWNRSHFPLPPPRSAQNVPFFQKYYIFQDLKVSTATFQFRENNFSYSAPIWTQKSIIGSARMDECRISKTTYSKLKSGSPSFEILIYILFLKKWHILLWSGWGVREMACNQKFNSIINFYVIVLQNSQFSQFWL